MMNIAIYQINMERDEERLAFRSFDSLGFEDEPAELNSKIYDKVFDGEVDCANLEDVYTMFNLYHPTGYRGRSLSVSDVVEVKERGKSRFHFCDSYGFREVLFEPVDARKAAHTIKVVLLEPGKLAKVADIDASLYGMQRVVGGNIEVYYPFEEEVCIVCNEEGKINGMSLNRAIYDGNEMVEIIAGPCFICDCSGENFRSLSDEQLKRYSRQFKYPEEFIKMNGEIKAIPFTPDKSRER